MYAWELFWTRTHASVLAEHPAKPEPESFVYAWYAESSRPTTAKTRAVCCGQPKARVRALGRCSGCQARADDVLTPKA
jgi:hypothetical protein